MIPHEAKRVNIPPKADAGFTERVFECFRGAGSLEKVTSVITAVDDVIDRSGKLNSKATCHRSSKRLIDPSRQTIITPI